MKIIIRQFRNQTVYSKVEYSNTEKILNKEKRSQK